MYVVFYDLGAFVDFVLCKWCFLEYRVFLLDLDKIVRLFGVCLLSEGLKRFRGRGRIFLRR